MGFFSFITQDTKRSIPNRYSPRATFRVFMHDNKGNVYSESDYDGYGEFGKMDYYELLAKMNGLADRYDAIRAYYDNTDGLLYPNLSESEDWQWRNERTNKCPDQGYFYEGL